MILADNILVTNVRDYSESSLSETYLKKYGFIIEIYNNIYTFTPFGMLFLNNIISIIKNYMVKMGYNECKLPILTPLDNWNKRVNDEKFTSPCNNGGTMVFAPTSEETICRILNYSVLPIKWFQISTNFRNEIRPQFGLIRTREFLMKDAYGVFETSIEAIENYENFNKCYEILFKQLGFDIQINEVYEDGKSTEFLVLSKDKRNIKSTRFNGMLATEIAHTFLFDYPCFEYNIVSAGIGICRLLQIYCETFLENNEKGFLLDWGILNPFEKWIILRNNSSIKDLEDEFFSSNIMIDNRDISVSKKIHDAKALGMNYEII